tara:strand:- start:109 stop:348 length:240 start_codon:yes stop_codon:yes gene_type:complete
MGKFRKGQKVVVIETGDICTIDVISGGIIWLSNSNRPHSESQLKSARLHVHWRRHANVADVLPSAAHTANRAIERMINQ